MVSPSITPTTLPVKSAAQTIVGMSKAANSRNGVLCGTRVVAGWLQIAITLRVDEELECGSLDSVRQICCEIVNPGKRQQPNPACSLFVNGVPIGFEQLAILVQAIDSGCAPLIGVVREQSQRWD